MSEKNTLRIIVVILLLLVLIPTAFYTAYEFSTLNAHEQMLSEMYNRQLDAILYSVNEHATAVVTNWANRLSKLYEKERAVDSAAFEKELKSLSREIRADGFSFSDSTGKGFAGPDFQSDSIIARHAFRLGRLPRYLRSGYRKLEPLFPCDSSSPHCRMLIVFAIGSSSRNTLIGVRLQEEEFIRAVIATKLRDIAGNSLILGVKLTNSNYLIFSTSETNAEGLRQKKTLWLFPNYELGIRLKGTTIDELAQSRTKRNVILILLMDSILLAGVWFIYKAIRREIELARLKSDFVSNVSHELRTPLALIRMYGETLHMGRVASEEKKQEYYATIVTETERLTRLVNNILDFSRMEAGKRQYVFSDVQLNDLLLSVMATYEFHLKGEGVTPIIELDQSLPTISADVEAVSEAIVNLIDNAVKYSRENKFLKVKTLQRNGSCVVEVHDHGIGIAAEHHGKIFDKFFRVGNSLVHNTKGSGLGLALVKHIVNAHGGRVEVESAVGKGSTFRLVFPRP